MQRILNNPDNIVDEMLNRGFDYCLMVDSDVVLPQEALTNLVENASRFIEPGGHITIDLSGLHGSSVIQVKDDGCGFGDIDPNLLFGRFYRADTSRARNTGGTGLGLAIVKSIVDAHDGTIEADYEVVDPEDDKQ